MSKKQQIIFEDIKPAEFAIGFRSRIAKEVAIIDFIHAEETQITSEGEEIKKRYISSSIALTKDAANDLIEKLKKFIDENGN